jgi:HSP20 family protein
MFGCAPQAFRPNADVYYSKIDNAIYVKLELPGVDPEGTNLEVEDQVLRISGHRVDRGRREKVYQQMEVFYGPFERRILLPVQVDAGAAKAHYRDGFLEIELPVAAVRESRRIPIKVKEQAESPSPEETAVGAETSNEDGTP